MHIYYLLLLFLFFVGVVEVSVKPTNKTRYIFNIIATISLLLYVGLKIKGGTDFESYRTIYDDFSYTSFNGLFTGFIEPFFLLLIAVTKYLNIGYVGFHFVVTSINIPMKTKAFSQLTPYIFPALLIYASGLLFERDNDGFRQGLAIAFNYISIAPLLRGKNLQFVILNLCATCIHYSSIVFLAIVLLRKIEWKDIVIFYIVSICFLFSVLGISLSNILISFIPIPAVATKLQLYAQNGVESVSVGINIGVIFRFFILILFLLNHRRLKINEGFYIILRNGFAFSLCMSLLFSDFAILSHRLPYAFREFQIFIVSYFFTIVKGRTNRVLLLFVILAYTIIIVSRFLSGENAPYYEYDNLLFHIFE